MTDHKEIKNKPHTSRALFALIGTALAVLLAVAVSVIVVDPFFHYHAPLARFPYVVDNQLSQNPGMAEHFLYDSVIIGSSMTVNFDTDDFRELMDLNTIKLSYSGAYPKDDANIMRIVTDADSDLKAVFLPMDIPTMTADTDEVKFPAPAHLYDKNPFNDVKYVLNKDVFLQYVVRPILHPDPTDLSMVYASWWTDEYYNESYVLGTHTWPPAADPLTQEEIDIILARTQENLEENFAPFLEENQETTFYVFFPPYSILYWQGLVREGRLEAVMEQTRLVTDWLSAYDNVRVFFFQDMEETVCDLNNYADYSHYHPRTNRFMTECFASGAYEVKEGNVEVQIGNIREMIKRHPFAIMDEAE